MKTCKSGKHLYPKECRHCPQCQKLLKARQLEKDPDYWKKEYAKRLEKDPDFNKKAVARQLEKDPDYWKKEYAKRLEKDPDCKKKERARQLEKDPDYKKKERARQLEKDPDYWKKASARLLEKDPDYKNKVQARILAKDINYFRKGAARRLERDPEYNSRKAKKRAAAIDRATPKWLTGESHKLINMFYIKKPVGYAVDHVFPIQGVNVSGLNVPWNLQYLKVDENRYKSNRFDGTESNNGWREGFERLKKFKETYNAN